VAVQNWEILMHICIRIQPVDWVVRSSAHFLWLNSLNIQRPSEKANVFSVDFLVGLFACVTADGTFCKTIRFRNLVSESFFLLTDLHF